MKRLLTVLTTIVAFSVLTLTAPAVAQRGQHHPEGRPGPMMGQADTTGGMMGMMRGEMMGSDMMGRGMMQMMQGMRQQMMQSPMHRSQMSAFMLPALADTLGLSEDQVAQIEQLRSEAMNRRQEQRQQMMARRRQMMSLFEGEETPPADQMREHMSAMAEMRAEHQADLYETAQRMREVLTEEQRSTLDALTPQQQMRQMMSRMSMMEMMEMMQSMRSGMMGGGMMGGGMMGGMQGMPMMRGGEMGPQGERPMRRHQPGN